MGPYPMNIVECKNRLLSAIKLNANELKKFGFKRTLKKLLFFRVFHFSNDFWYHHWISKNERNPGWYFWKKEDFSSFSYRPKISILMPVWNIDPLWLKMAIRSVSFQSYQNWELCIVYAGPHDPSVCELLSRAKKSDQRIRLKYIDVNEGISGNTNKALEMASGEFTGFLDQDDELAPFALKEVVDLLNRNKSLNLIYSDHDIIDTTGKRRDPYFKPDFSLPLLFSGNFLLHFVVCRTSILRKIGGIREGFEGAQEYDLNLRLTEIISRESISHIRKILYHWRCLETSCALNVSKKPLSSHAGKLALEQYLKRNNIQGEVIPLPHNAYRVRFSPFNSPNCILLFLWRDVDDEMDDPKGIREVMEWIRSQAIPCIIPETYGALCRELHPVMYYKGKACHALSMIKMNHDTEFVIVVHLPQEHYSPMAFNDHWLDELVNLYSVFSAGVVGCGAPVFHNVLCSVPFPCGPLFCVKRLLLEKYLNSRDIIPDFPGFQKDISRFAEEEGLENISTPFCIQVLRDPILLYDYYHPVKDHQFFTRNMRYYLKPVFFE